MSVRKSSAINSILINTKSQFIIESWKEEISRIAAHIAKKHFHRILSCWSTSKSILRRGRMHRDFARFARKKNLLFIKFKIYLNTFCSRLCPNLKAYQSHISHHQPPKRPFVCEVSSWFNRPDYLNKLIWFSFQYYEIKFDHILTGNRFRSAAKHSPNLISWHNTITFTPALKLSVVTFVANLMRNEIHWESTRKKNTRLKERK